MKEKETKRQRDRQHLFLTSKKITICDVTDIVECVGLVKYSSTKNKYKVIWPHALFHKKLDKKLVGKLKDL